MARRPHYYNSKAKTEDGIEVFIGNDGFLFAMGRTEFNEAVSKLPADKNTELQELYDPSEECIWWNSSKDRQGAEFHHSYVSMNPGWFKGVFGQVGDSEPVERQEWE